MNNLEFVIVTLVHAGIVILLCIVLFIIIGLVIEKIRAVYDKSLWDTRELARRDLGRQIVNGSHWFNPDEMKLIKIVGENIINNSGSFDPSSARETYRNEP